MTFEVVVRPVVFPNIRPTVARALRIEDAPDKGIATITGGGGVTIIDLPYSNSGSWAHSRQKEIKRKFDVGRIYSQDSQGKIDKQTYLEAEFVRSINYKDGSSQEFSETPERDNLEITKHNQTRSSG